MSIYNNEKQFRDTLCWKKKKKIIKTMSCVVIICSTTNYCVTRVWVCVSMCECMKQLENECAITFKRPKSSRKNKTFENEQI